ncbi:uncharacterized protein LOC120279052 [Dioscorea cayenensis subsp. rotundata]|uniref:Uncharacterized protein LOC120279052 n=1 Tax=Dioscorea cayennensis subsp. rotundata TaxID=55577 RepID=A0AB40CP15_DIOCR|nr:uncharacterized protein LOC120279052 [Dioscorea cayenensis subsp. rotundata]XP_039141832.1 uncharacterized protein LOC120279052 [Dioscorea cayenensis subsp. rotundata]
MAACNSFDQWQKDVFFSAAEEVQESSDVMESLYRLWMRECSDGCKSEALDELRRELHTALSTAKWQLEEFERAVRLSHENCSSEENTITRHKQFIAAIGDRISHVEKALSDSLIQDGKQPLRWVQLDDEERDDLAAFLAVVPKSLQKIKDDKDVNCDAVRGFKETLRINKDANYVVQVEANECFKVNEETCAQEDLLNGLQRRSASSDLGAWKIVIADENVETKTTEVMPETLSRPSGHLVFPKSVKSTVKSKWLRNSFPRIKSKEHFFWKRGLIGVKGVSRFAQGINRLNERGKHCLSNCATNSKVSNVHQRSLHSSQFHTSLGRSVRVALIFIMAILLIVPIVLYST